MDPFSVVVGAVGLATVAYSSALHLQRRKDKLKRLLLKKGLPRLDDISNLESSRIDICFVHGLNGDFRSTWTDERTKTCWPEEFLRQQHENDHVFPSARILLYGYDTAVRSLCWLTRRTLHIHALDLRDRLVADRKHLNREEKPILFIAHGFGGLLVKLALMQAQLGNPDQRALHRATFGLVSFAAPHIYSSPVDETFRKHVEQLFQIPRQLQPELPTHDFEDKLDHADRWSLDLSILAKSFIPYTATAIRVPEVFCYGDDEFRGLGTIASRDISVPPREKVPHPHCRKVMIEGNHLDMAKFTSRDDQAYKRICKLIRKYYTEFKPAPDNSLQFHYRKGPVKPLAHRTPLPPQNTPLHATLPPRNSKFIGRNPLLASLAERLRIEHLVAITGPSGFGKSALALEFAHQSLSENRFDAIFWLQADSDASLASGFRDIHEEVYNESNSDSHRTMDTSTLVREVINYLLSPDNKRWLLIYDDVTDSDGSLIRPYLPQISDIAGRIIITTRLENINTGVDKLETISSDGPRFYGNEDVADDKLTPSTLTPVFSPPLRVPTFDREEAVQILTKASRTDTLLSSIGSGFMDYETLGNPKYEDVMDDIIDIAEELKDEPYKINQMAEVFATKSVHSVSQISGQLKPAGSLDESLSIFSDDCPGALLLDPCLFLERSRSIPLVLTSLILGSSSEEARNELRELDSGHRTQETAYWITLDQDSSFEITELFWRHRVAYFEAKPNYAKECAEKACWAIIEAIKSKAGSTRLRTLLSDHALAWRKAVLQHKNQFTRELEWDVLARLWEEKGHFREADWLYRHAIDTDLKAADTMTLLEQELREGDRKSAAWHDTDSDLSGDLVVRQQEAGAEHPEFESFELPRSTRLLTCKVGHIRASLAYGSILEDECAAVLRDVSSPRSRTYSQIKVTALQQMIQIKIVQNDWVEAINYSQGLIETTELVHGLAGSHTIAAVLQMGKILLDAAKYHDAQLCFQRVVMTLEEVSATGDETVVVAQQLLALAHREQGNLEQAEQEYKVVLRILDEQLEPGHIEIAKAQANLAVVYTEMGKYADAQACFDVALRVTDHRRDQESTYVRILQDAERNKRLNSKSKSE